MPVHMKTLSYLQRFTAATALLSLFFLPNFPLMAADRLVLANGDHVQGDLTSMKEGQLFFVTPYAGELSIAWDQVRELVSDDPVGVLLEDGQMLEVTEFLQSGEGEVMLGSLEVPRSSILQLNPSDWEVGNGYYLGGAVDLALKIDRGNTRSEEADIAADVEWRKKQHRLRFLGELEYDLSENEESRKQWFTQFKYDNFVSTHWYYGASTLLKRDYIEEPETLLSVGPYIGREFIRSAATNLSAEAGVDYVSEGYRSEADRDYWAAAWSIDADHYLLPSVLQVYHRMKAFANIDELGNLVLDTWTGVRIPMKGGFVTSAELKAEYDGGAVEDTKAWDTTWRLKFGYRW